ncbi:hypothetical protein [Synechococcus sp. H65.1]|uniref:hypothetical protein n=1 Tax=unclassified Synechococcus TaxID=2626047 RepID=UPI0039C2DA26
MRLQYYVRRSCDADFQQCLQAVGFRSVKAEVVDRRSTTIQRFDPPSVQVMAPQAETKDRIRDGKPRRRNPLRLLVQAIWRQLRG